MKILLINNHHYKFGGAGTVYLNTARLLQEKGHEVIFFSVLREENIKTDYDKFFIKHKVDVKARLLNKIRNFNNYFYNKQASYNLDQLLRKEKPDIAHIHLYLGGLTSSILPILKRHKIPVVHTAHDYRLVCPSYTFLDGKGEICERCKGKNFYLCAIHRCSKNNFIESLVMSVEMYYRNAYYNPRKYIDGFIYVSNFSKNKHLQYFPALNERKNIVLYNFTLQEKLMETSKEDYFLFFGRLSHEKGLFTLIKAFARTTDSKLIIAGDGPLHESIISFIKEKNILNIECIGFVEGLQLVELIKKAKFVVVPSEWYENNPMTIVEAYTNGTPVIGADIGGITEIVVNEQTGFLYESRNLSALRDVLLKAKKISNQHYTRMCTNAVKFAEDNFNEKSYLDKIMNFYTEVINNYEQ